MIVFYCQVSFWSLTKKKRNACFWYFVHCCTDYKKGEGGKRREGDFHLCRKCSYKTQKGVADAWPFLGFSSLRDLRAGKVEKLFNVKRILDIDGSRQWPFYARWKCWKIDVAWCENLVTLCKLVQSILQHFAENVVLCSFNNYPFWLYLSGRASWAPSVFQRSTTQALLLKMFFLSSLHFIPLFPLSTHSSVPELFSIQLLSFVKWFCPDTSGSGWSALPWEHALQPQVASTMNTLLSQFPSCCHGSTFGAAGLLSRTSLIPWYEQKLDLISAFDQITSQQSAVIRKFLCSLYPQSSGLCRKGVAGLIHGGNFKPRPCIVHLIYFLL